MKKVARTWANILVAACCLLALTFVWEGTALSSRTEAIAAPQFVSPQLVAANTVEKLDRKAKSDLDAVVGAGTSDKLEGQVDEAVGTVERNLGKMGGEAEGAAKQAKGQAKQSMGEAKSAIDEAADNVEEASEGFMDSVKGFFGN